MPIEEYDLSLQPVYSRRRALTIPLPYPPLYPPQTLLRDRDCTRVQQSIPWKSKISSVFAKKASKLRSSLPFYPLVQQTCDQSDSLIFNLPKEISNMIWKCVIGKSFTNVWVGCIASRYDDPNFCDPSSLKISILSEQRGAHVSPEQRRANYVFCLIQTCRLVYVYLLTSHSRQEFDHLQYSYSELVPLWYRQVKFTFKYFLDLSLSYFGNFLPEVSLHKVHLKLNLCISISSFCLKQICDHGKMPGILQWESNCRSLAATDQLKTLSIDIGFIPYMSTTPLEAESEKLDLWKYQVLKRLCLINVKLDLFEVKTFPCAGYYADKLLDDCEVDEVPFILKGDDGVFPATAASPSATAN